MTASDEVVGELLLEEARNQISACHQKIKHCAEQLTDEQLWHRAGENFNSIANLLLHLNGNIAERINGLIGGDASNRDRQREFDQRELIPKAQLLARFDATIERALQVLAELPTQRLSETRRYRLLRGEVEGSFVALILHTAVHLGGHMQEIVAMTRSLLGKRYRFLQTAGQPGK